MSEVEESLVIASRHALTNTHMTAFAALLAQRRTLGLVFGAPGPGKSESPR
jgi:hypothetical protein